MKSQPIRRRRGEKLLRFYRPPELASAADWNQAHHDAVFRIHRRVNRGSTAANGSLYSRPRNVEPPLLIARARGCGFFVFLSDH